MSQKSKHSVKAPTFTYAKCLATNRCERRYLLAVQDKLDSHASQVKRQIRSQQASVLRRFYGLCGNELLQTEIDELDKRIQESCPLDILSADGILLHRAAEINNPEKPSTPSLRRQTASGGTRGAKAKSDLGLINSKGHLELGDFSRPLYPWETESGMKWLKSLGSAIIQTPHRQDPGHTSHSTKADKAKVQKLSNTSEQTSGIAAPPMCRSNNNLTKKDQPLIDISQVIGHYESQHQKIFIRNYFQRQKQKLLTRYDTLFLEENLLRHQSPDLTHRHSAKTDKTLTTPSVLSACNDQKSEKIKQLRENERDVDTFTKLPPIPERSITAKCVPSTALSIR